MAARLKTLLLAAMLLVMPLQGAAATLAGLLCDPGAQMHKVLANGGHDRDTPQDGEQDKDNAGANPVWHPFHGTVLGPVVETLPAAASDSPSWAHAPDISYALFVPGLPQRPPLA
jgi:hypothetical protein